MKVAEVSRRIGTVIDEFSVTWGAWAEYNVEDGECLTVRLWWKTRYGLEAWIILFIEDDSYSVGAFVNKLDITLGRDRSWDKPLSSLRDRLNELKTQLESFVAPPLEPAA